MGTGCVDSQRIDDETTVAVRAEQRRTFIDVHLSRWPRIRLQSMQARHPIILSIAPNRPMSARMIPRRLPTTEWIRIGAHRDIGRRPTSPSAHGARRRSRSLSPRRMILLRRLYEA